MLNILNALRAGVITGEITRKGHTGLWEEGGAFTNTGEAIIVTTPSGGRKRPLFVVTSGPRACENHALFKVSVDDCIVYANKTRRSIDLMVFRITAINGNQISVSRIPETDINRAAIDAALSKVNCYHCREPYYLRLDR